ncbi:UbiA prenyltransferase family protein [Candidatus Microgenomates bacterium]|nr:UbiA prenyltransferase family protein [Candidatus Microgenomates bacterium]
MVNQIQALISSARPTHWVKNLALFAALIFSGNLFVEKQFMSVLWAVVIFSIAASAIYLFNDVVDREHDLKHPIKKRRPVAQGTLPVPHALFFATTFAVVSLFLASFISTFFLMALTIYLLLQIAYALFLKAIPIIDILTIAAGFIIRVWAGAFVINVHLSVWFLLCVVSVSLFLASGKRRAELAILARYGKVRAFSYEPILLDSYLTMFGTATWLSWSLFTFFEPSPRIGILPFSSELPLTLAGIGKWLMVTIPIAIFGIMRYLYITYTSEKGTSLVETPERLLVRDKTLLTAFLLWGLFVVFVLYSI